MTQVGTKIEITLIGDSAAVDKALQEIKEAKKNIEGREGIEYCQEFSEDFPL